MNNELKNKLIEFDIKTDELWNLMDEIQFNEPHLLDELSYKDELISSFNRIKSALFLSIPREVNGISKRNDVDMTKHKDLEIVICSAIKLPNGKIFRGHRHGDCIKTAHEYVTWNGGINPGEHHWKISMVLDQGFITSKNRYVSREEALQIQLNAGIASVASGGYRYPDLYSEDLY